MLALIKYNLLGVINAFKGKNKKKSNVMALITLVLVGVIVLGAYTLQAYSMYDGLGKLGLNDMVLFHGISTAVCVMLIISFMRITGKQKNNDTDFLLSLPIKKSKVVLYKTISKYIFDLVFSSLLLIPFLVLYFIYEKITVLSVINSILVVFLLPCLSVGISLILDFFVTRFFNKFKYSNVIKSLFAVILFLLVLIPLLINSFSYGTQNQESLQNMYNSKPFSYLILKAILNPTVLNCSLFLIIIASIFVVGYILYTVNFGKTFLRYKNKSTKFKFNKSKSPYKNLLKKELKKYFSTPAYIINTIIGLVLMVVLSVVLIFQKELLSMLGIVLQQDIIAVICVLFSAMLSTVVITACSISLEGKQIWIIKSAPIKSTTIFNSKLSLSLMVALPFIVISSVIAIIGLNLTAYYFVYLLLYSGVFMSLISVMGLFINLLIPKLDYKDETKVVKQSMSVTITLFISMMIAVVPLILYFVMNISFFNISLISLLLNIILLIVFSLLLYIKGKKLFKKL